MKKIITFLFSLLTFSLMAQSEIDFATNAMECTTITVGKKASKDGSVMTSHTDDSGRSRTNIKVAPAADHPAGTMLPLYKRVACKPDTNPMPSYCYELTGEIPQVSHTYQFLNTAYPCMNEHQLAIGESTFGGRPELRSSVGFIDCQTLCQLMLQRCKTAREAIRTAGDLLKEYGWVDGGECLTIADKNEVWHLEIVGPGKGKKGAVWAAQRVPDDHIAVNANASTIREINLKDKDYFMASDNVYQVAEENGWYDKRKESFRFAYAYAPESRTMLACRRREWRVFDLLAPSLKLDANMENYPFSVKPDSLVSLEDMVRVFQDYYENTEYDMRKTLTVSDKEGKTIISPLANPFMKTDEQKLFKINGGWHAHGERNIAVWFTVYATILQCRDWLPDEVGGLCWFALDNVASSVYVPIYAGVTDLPAAYKTCGRETGFSREAAWWGFNRLGTLAAQRWGDMRHYVEAAWKPLQTALFANQQVIESEALLKLQTNRADCLQFLTQYTNKQCQYALQKAWDTGDLIWTKFDGAW